MPIRTNRGRAAVYRRLWGWPMRSPKHLVATVTVFAIVVTMIGLIVPKLLGRDDRSGSAAATLGGGSSVTTTQRPGSPGAGGAPGAAPTTTTTSPLPTRMSGPAQTPTSAPPAPQALEIALLWARAWVDHPQGTTAEQWLNRLRPYSTEEQMILLASVDPANVPATAVTGPVVPKNSHTTSVEATVTTNGGTLDITVIQTPQGWRVAQYKQAA